MDAMHHTEFNCKKNVMDSFFKRFGRKSVGEQSFACKFFTVSLTISCELIS